MTRLLPALLVASPSLLACVSPAPQAASDVEHWRSQGYGYVLEVEDGAASVLHVTAQTCVRDEALAGADVSLAELGVTPQADALIYTDSTTQITFERAPELPPPCAPDRILDGAADPRATFDLVWHTVDEHFPYFDVVGVDWDEARDARAQVTDAGSLYATLVELLAPLRDGHMLLSDGVESFDGASATLRARLGPQFEAQSHTQDFGEYVELAAQLNAELVFADYVTPLGVGANDQIYWGTIDGEVGYVLILGMIGLSADIDLETLLAGGGGWTHGDELVAAEIAAAEAAIDAAIDELGDAQALVVDVRFNGGGLDSVSRAIAARFADQARVGYRKAAVHEGALLPPREYVITPVAEPWSGPVRVLSSPLSASGAEVFLMTMREFQHVQLVGQPSLGALSDSLSKPLPLPGWSFSLSNEVYTTPAGERFEFVGVPVDTEVPVLVLDELSGPDPRDAALEAALAELHEALG
ncbi:Periplasmic protease [Plesiocystis pacifica SIR-1]|uniref:Periplasmic protease n=1 Tax=Plesiocystis pacifica SIR-1 TaxID=391625 RepID=A6FYA2_9BACT|nr:S41 family peptidase [Plesiocystis pacifica]EDM81481.1 Periplasmic protease [Plesiocystis pacifica SIR-1]